MNVYAGNNRHSDSLEIGLEFQDFVMMNFMELMGFNISYFQSKKYQYQYGESLQGIEIKYDARCTGDCTHYKNAPTGNVAIEVFEKVNKNNSKWVESGILRKDNTWLYAVGNYHQIWIFSKKRLLDLYRVKRYDVKATLPTSKCMLMPIDHADSHCEKKLIFRQNNLDLFNSNLAS